MELMEAVSLKPMDTFLLAQINRGWGEKQFPEVGRGYFSLQVPL